jgi:hypothetical protein
MIGRAHHTNEIVLHRGFVALEYLVWRQPAITKVGMVTVSSATNKEIRSLEEEPIALIPSTETVSKNQNSLWK